MKTLCKLLTLLIIAQLCTISIAYSTDYHVSLSGSDTTGNGSLSNPWRHPEYGAKKLQAGDTLFIHAGTYALSPSNQPVANVTRARAMVAPPYGINGTPENPITIKNAGDGTVLLDAGTSPEWPAVGTANNDYLIIDGVSVRGAAILWGTTGSIIQNCDLYGGIDTPESNNGDNFGCVVRIEGCNDCIVQNNKLHDNQIGIHQRNSPLLIEYDSNNLTIRNNDIYNSVGSGIFLKDRPENAYIYYNHIYNNTLSGFETSNQDDGYNVNVYQNIIRDNNTEGHSENGGIRISGHVSGLNIYNNTFEGNSIADILDTGYGVTGIQVWNNIFINSSSHFYDLIYTATFDTTWTYSNYNNFYGSANLRENSEWTTLSSFQTATGLDSKSVITNPNIHNSSGTLASDFKRSSYPTNGRGGEYKNVLGAYVTGNETIGYSSSPAFGPSVPKAPADFK